MEEWLYDVLYYLTWVCYTASIVFLLVIKKWGSGFLTRALFSYLTVSLMTDVICEVTAQYNIHNFPILHVYTIIITLILVRIYWEVFKESVVRKVLVGFAVLFTTLAIFLFFYDSGYKKANVVTDTILNLMALTLSVRYFYMLFKTLEIPSLAKHFFFWMNSAFLVYFGTTLFLSMFDRMLRYPGSEVFYYTYPIQLVATILFNLILMRGIWKTR